VHKLPLIQNVKEAFSLARKLYGLEADYHIHLLAVQSLRKRGFIYPLRIYALISSV
jgi:hypothetical protein